MKKTYLLVACLTALGLPPSALAATDAPTVDSILDKFVTASGGKAAFEKVKSRSIKGKVELPAMSATNNWELLAKAPNKEWSQVEIAGAGAMVEGFDGTVAWAKSPFDGLRVKQGDELAKARRDADFHRDLHFKSLYPDLAYKGKETFEGEEILVLESKPSASSKERFSFSAKTSLLIRQESEFEGQPGKVRVDARLSEYRPVEGITLPHLLKCNIEAGDQKFEFTLRFTEIKFNVPVEDSKFAKPAE